LIGWLIDWLVPWVVVRLAGVCAGGERRRRAVEGGRWAMEGGSSRQQGWAAATRDSPPFPANKTHMVSNVFFYLSIGC